jgi:glycosyltransferase involved in cell wall biosynthesis
LRWCRRRRLRIAVRGDPEPLEAAEHERARHPLVVALGDVGEPEHARGVKDEHAPAAADATDPALDQSQRSEGVCRRVGHAERERLGLERPFVLALGTIEPRKNLERLIQAYVGLPEALRQRFELCLAGATGWKTGPILDLAEQHRDSVRRLGYVADEDLPALYRGAELFVYPSLAEGFGLPVLEAMQSGTAVITSNVSSMPEVGGDAARYVNPRDVTDIRTALQELLSDDAKRAELAARGPAQAARFSWHRTAEETLTAIEAAAAT